MMINDIVMVGISDNDDTFFSPTFYEKDCQDM